MTLPQKNDGFMNVAQYTELEKDDSKFTLIDVRTKEEYDDCHIHDAVWIPYDGIKLKISELVPDTSEKVIVYCRTNRRSGIAASTLQEMGYENVKILDGGFLAFCK